MSPDKSLQTLFNEALEREDPVERARFIDEACGTDAALRQRVEKLLRAAADAGGFFSQPYKEAPGQAPISTVVPLAEKAGDKIGRYKLLQEIGEGGCGVVYMAEQEEPVRRRVALKAIKLGMDTRQVIARFEAERQALALMDHPHIAQVLDAGASETGRPYFVMELVRGTRITDFCDQKKLSARERLELFVQVCQAIQHAHQKGIIHRDLKPSNILITTIDGNPVPKVIDFGIAKATNNQRLTDRTLFTAFEQFIGTPAYMSPEQAEMSGVDIDTRTDIYSLGVVLYELLTGRTPFDPEQLLRADIEGIRRTIREQEPPKPSTRLDTMSRDDLTTTAQARQTDVPKLIRQLRGDLDWIVMKCLEKERDRRYESAHELARDVERYLNSEPVVARPPSRLYEFQKTVRRHQFGFAAAAAVAVALVLGLGVSTWLFFKEREARRVAVSAEGRALAGEQKAMTQAVKNEQIAQFLKSMILGVGPSVARGRDPTMIREMLGQTAELVSRDLNEQPEVQAELWSILGTTYFELGDPAKAEIMHRDVLRVRKALFGATNSLVAVSLTDLANAVFRNDSAEGESLAREALAIWNNLPASPSSQVASSLACLAAVLNLQGKLAEAEIRFREALTILRQTGRQEYPRLAYLLNELVLVLVNQGKLAEAESLSLEAVALGRNQPEQEHPALATSLLRLGFVFEMQGRLTAAEPLCREAAMIRRKVLGFGHPEAISSLDRLCSVLSQESKLGEIKAVMAEQLSGLRARAQPEDITLAASLAVLAKYLLAHQAFAEAEAPARESLAIREKTEPHRWPAFHSRSMLGGSLLGQMRLAEAEPLLVSGCRGLKELELSIQLPAMYRLQEAQYRLVQFYEASGLPEQAAYWRKEMADWYRRRGEAYRRAPEIGDLQALNGLARLLATGSDPTIRDGRFAAHLAERAVAATQRKNADYLDTLAAAYAEAGQFSQAFSVQNEAMALLQDEARKKEFALRLKLYESNSPYRDNRP